MICYTFAATHKKQPQKMKKIIFTLIAGLAGYTAVYAQPPSPLTNGGLETWIDQTTYEEPQGWGTLNIYSSIVSGFPVTVEKTTDKHSGTYAAKLTTVVSPTPLAPNFPTDSVPGLLFGNDVLGQGGKFGIPYTDRPDTVSFWYKYLPAGVDSGVVLIQLTKTVGNTKTIVGQATGFFNVAIPTYTQQNIGMFYPNANTDTPDTLSIIFASSGYALKLLSPTFASIPLALPKPGSTLFLDDFSLLFNATGLNENNGKKVSINLYPNPANNELTIACTGHQFGDRTLDLDFFDMTGRKVSTTKLGSAIERIDVSTMASGVYIYCVKDGQNVLRTGKISVTK